ncbi:MAG: glutamate-5-semialdehyde dehydrogenase [Gammaproteobacteria bacterium]|nr:glutamate-5-semialdehyde dehydrogenase [Gammaproteobacteria bacterium]
MTFSIQKMAQQAKKASIQVAQLDTATKNKILLTIADNLRADEKKILAANAVDIENAQANDLPAAMIDRLLLDHDRIEGIAQAVEYIASLADPVGLVTKTDRLPNNLIVSKKRIPLGVIAMIYESRPNVTIDAAALCFKAGNTVVLRGGKEALHSNLALAESLQIALKQFDIDPAAVSLVPDPDREIMNELLTLNEEIDLLIPRGGENLIRYVSQNSRIPVIQHFKGVCHLYVDKMADEVKALDILVNGKVQRPSACNSLETLLVHKDRAESFLPAAAAKLNEMGVKVHACEQSLKYFENADLATDLDYDAEYLALEIAVRVVDDYDQAVEHIQRFSSDHTEVIITQDISLANKFVQQINSAVVMVNASSRFSDGGELGLGAEIGISTSKLHAYGPMGLESLTTEKFVVMGDGQVRS